MLPHTTKTSNNNRFGLLGMKLVYQTMELDTYIRNLSNVWFKPAAVKNERVARCVQNKYAENNEENPSVWKPNEEHDVMSKIKERSVHERTVRDQPTCLASFPHLESHHDYELSL